MHVPKDKLQESVEMFLRLYPGKRLWVDGTVVQLGAPATAAAGPASGPTAGPGITTQGVDALYASMAAVVKMSTMMFAEHLECQRRLTDEVMQQFQRVRASLDEIDVMARGARVVEFQEFIRGIQASGGGPRQVVGDERRSWRNEQFERFVIGGLKATKIVEDA